MKPGIVGMLLLEFYRNKGIIERRVFVSSPYGEYIGIASDGVEVRIGVVGEEDTIYKYLEEHPTPRDW